MKGNVTAGLGALPRALPRAVSGGLLPPLHPHAGFGEVVTVTGTPACLSARCFEHQEAFRKNVQVRNPLFKEEPAVLCVSSGNGESSPGEPRMLASWGSCGHLHWFFLPHETTGKFPAAGLVESTNSSFWKAENPSGSSANCRQTQFQLLLKTCIISRLNLLCLSFQ